MFNFKKTVEASVPYQIGVVHWLDRYYAKVNGELYPIVYDIEKYKILYSLPTNSQHEEWSKRVVNKVINSIYVNMYWGAFKPKQKVKGIIKDKVFYVKV